MEQWEKKINKKIAYDHMTRHHSSKAKEDFHRPAYYKTHKPEENHSGEKRNVTPKLQTLIDIQILHQLADYLTEQEKSWLHDTALKYFNSDRITSGTK